MKEKDENRYIIEAVWTATRVIEAVAMSKDPLGSAEIAKAIDVTDNMAFRQCCTLVQGGIFEECGNKKFKLGLKMALYWARKKANLEGERDRIEANLKEMNIEETV